MPQQLVNANAPNISEVEEKFLNIFNDLAGWLPSPFDKAAQAAGQGSKEGLKYVVDSRIGDPMKRSLNLIDARYFDALCAEMQANAIDLGVDAVKDYLCYKLGLAAEALGLDHLVLHRSTDRIYNLAIDDKVKMPDWMATALASSMCWCNGDMTQYRAYRANCAKDAGLDKDTDISVSVAAMYQGWVGPNTDNPLAAATGDQNVLQYYIDHPTTWPLAPAMLDFVKGQPSQWTPAFQTTVATAAAKQAAGANTQQASIDNETKKLKQDLIVDREMPNNQLIVAQARQNDATAAQAAQDAAQAHMLSLGLGAAAVVVGGAIIYTATR